jgi:predicted nucleic acid-binding protein
LPATEVKNRFGQVLREIDSGRARLAGEWMQCYESRGLGWMEALIAATGAQAKLIILTRDAKLGRLLANEARFEVYDGAS